MDPLIDLIEPSLEFRWDAGAVTPMQHPHSTGWRVLPCLTVAAPCEGGRVRVEIEGRPPVVIAEGMAFCLRPGLRHNATLISRTGVSRWAHVTYRALGGVDPLSLIDAPTHVAAPRGERLGAICVELAAIARAPRDLAAAARRKALGFELLALVARDAPAAPAALERARALQRLAPALALIDREPGSGGAAVPALARAAGVSPSRLHALFRIALGRSPLQHALAARLNRAQRLLIGSDLAIADIAARAGFGDAFHFSRTFKRAFGESPSAYRARGLAI